MKIIKTEKNPLANDSLLGGAALSLSDLAIVESQEIEWLFSLRNDNEPDLERIAS